MDKQIFDSIRKQLEGKKLSVNNAISNIDFAQQSKKEANNYEWLYHCTNSTAFLSILNNQEFWLTNLKLVNDKEEAERIDVPEYEKSYYVACFTYDNNIPREHWMEYGNISDGVLIGVKKQWFLRNACFMDGENKKTNEDFYRIFVNEEDASDFIKKEHYNKRIVNPFYINEFSFYKIIYDDNLRKYIKGTGSLELSDGIVQVETLTPRIAGIIKSTHGFSTRVGKETYEKDWKSEKEVRLKVGIKQYHIFKNGYEIHDNMILDKLFHPKIAVPIKDNAFDIIRIRFSPEFIDRDMFIEKIKAIRPKSEIEILG